MKGFGIAIGIVEFYEIAIAIAGLDCAVKNNSIQILNAEMICPGGYLIIFGGKYAEVYGAVRILRDKYSAVIKESILIGNLSEGILNWKQCQERAEALGIIETKDAASIVYAADEAIKTSNISVKEMRLARGIGGKGIVVLDGEIAETIVAVEKAANLCRCRGVLVSSAVVTNPHEQTYKALFGI